MDQERTRQRIIEATVELHSSLGPKKTSISAVARRAGVQRLTVYRHFTDEFALFTACSSHWLSQNPPPDPGAWMSIAEPARRTRTALAALYGYYRRTAAMLTLVYRDLDDVDALRAPVEAFQAYLDGIRDDLSKAWRPARRTRRMLEPTIAHALAFSTWSSLSGLGLSDLQITRLVLGWIATTAGLARPKPAGEPETASQDQHC